MLLSETLATYSAQREALLVTLEELDAKLREQNVTTANQFVVFNGESYFSELAYGKLGIFPKDNPALKVLVDQ